MEGRPSIAFGGTVDYLSHDSNVAGSNGLIGWTEGAATTIDSKTELSACVGNCNYGHQEQERLEAREKEKAGGAETGQHYRGCDHRPCEE